MSLGGDGQRGGMGDICKSVNNNNIQKPLHPTKKAIQHGKSSNCVYVCARECMLGRRGKARGTEKPDDKGPCRI